MSLEYNNDLRVTSASVNGGSTVTYQYDADGLLVGAGEMNLTRDSSTGLLLGTQLGSVTTQRTYNAFGELASETASYQGNILSQVQYSRDKLGRIVSKVETLDGVTTTFEYSYDLAGRLVEVKQDGVVTESYEYDANGNRVQALTSVQGMVLGSYDDQDRLIEYGENRYTYTANGELLTKTRLGQTTTYHYDVFGNLRQVQLPGKTIEYVIDGRTRRVGKTVNGNLVQGFLYQGSLKPIAELDGEGNVVARFVYGSKGNVPDYLVKEGKTYRIISDHLGSPRLVVDLSNGDVAQKMDYDAFGNVVLDTQPGFQPFGFAGGMYDAETGLVRFGARDYDAESGRWTSKDPIGFEGGDSNLFGYVVSSPVNFIDPPGLDVTVIVNNNTLIIGTHVGVYDSSSAGNVLYDPGGSYKTPQKGSGDALYGEDANLPDYIEFQKGDGPKVQLFHFETTAAEDAEIRKRIEEQGGCDPGFCSICSGTVLRGIGPFKNLGSTRTPAGMASELRKLGGGTP